MDVNLGLSGEEERQSYLIRVKYGPVKRRAILSIDLVKVKVTIVEQVNNDRWRVALCREMQCRHACIVAFVHISTIVNEQFECFQVAIEGCIVDGSHARLLPVDQVEPLGERVCEHGVA